MDVADAQVAADLMLREPKTLAGDVSVADVRAVLSNPKVQMVLLADGTRFVGAVTEIPADASDDEEAVAYADASPETIAPTATADEAWAQALDSPHRRVIVLDDEGTLHGLLCLNHKRTGFCQTPTRG
jgi:CBS domain-containing protein